MADKTGKARHGGACLIVFSSSSLDFSGTSCPASSKDQAGTPQPVLGVVLLQPRAGPLCKLWRQVPLQLLVGGTRGPPTVTEA